MRSLLITVGLVALIGLSATFGVVIGRGAWMVPGAPVASPDQSPPIPDETPALRVEPRTAMGPDSALAIALRVLSDAKVKLFDSYKIVITRSEERSGWRVSIIALPETPGMYYWVMVEDDGRTAILPGL